MSKLMRIDRFIANNTFLSRSDVVKALKRQQVMVDGDLVKRKETLLYPEQVVTLDGVRINLRQAIYLMMNKPAGYVCASHDDRNPSVLNLLDMQDSALHMAGRLDMDTTGLVLLTDDGRWSHAITSPKKSCGKRYRVSLAELLTNSAERKLAEGLLLVGERTLTRPAQVERIDNRRIWLTIYEGRYHQIKRMLAAVGNRVTALHRAEIGKIKLDPDLEPGEYRPLTAEEMVL